MLDDICEFKPIRICVKAFFPLGISLKAGLDLMSMHKVVVAEKKKSMYKEINTSFIKTNEQYNVQ